MPVKVVGADGTATEADVAPGITWAADHGANVINLQFRRDLQLNHRRRDHLCDPQGRPRRRRRRKQRELERVLPGGRSGVLGVAATQPDDQLYSWSNYGALGPVRGSGLRSDYDA